MNTIECTNCLEETSIYESVCQKCGEYRHKTNREKFGKIEQ